MRERKVGRERERIAKALDRAVEPAQRFQRVAEVQLQSGVVRPQGDGSPDEVGGFFVASLLVAEHPQQVEGVGMDGIGVDRRAIVALGISESSVTMRRIGAREKGIHDGRQWRKRGIVPYSAGPGRKARDGRHAQLAPR